MPKTITINLSEVQLAYLRNLAAEREITLNDLIIQILEERLDALESNGTAPENAGLEPPQEDIQYATDEDVDEIIDHLMEKNAELYRRLA